VGWAGFFAELVDGLGEALAGVSWTRAFAGMAAVKRPLATRVVAKVATTKQRLIPRHCQITRPLPTSFACAFPEWPGSELPNLVEA
jgi:hypothetical protein